MRELDAQGAPFEKRLQVLGAFGELAEDWREPMARAVSASMKDAQQRVNRLRAELMSVKPDRGYADFDQQELLARSGRYPALNYLNR